MKKVLLLSMFFCSLFFTYTQTNYVYCQLVGTGKLFSTQVTVQADFGQERSFWKGVDYMRDWNGKKINFNSMVDAMNFMGKQGWEFVQAYVVTVNNQNVYHWLLKKEIVDEQDNKTSSNQNVYHNTEQINKVEVNYEADINGRWFRESDKLEIEINGDSGFVADVKTGAWVTLRQNENFPLEPKFQTIIKIGKLNWTCSDLLYDPVGKVFYRRSSRLTLNETGDKLTVSTEGIDTYTLFRIK